VRLRYIAIRRLPVLAVAVLAAAGLVSRAAQADPLADLKAAVNALQSKQHTKAIAALKPLGARLPKLADYVAWFLASSQFEAQQYADVPQTLEAVWTQTPPSPLFARSVLLAARAYMMNNDSRSAVQLLRKNFSKLAQPQADLALAKALVANNEPANAALYFQRVYYGYPLSSESTEAEPEIARLKAQLGSEYPPVLGSAILGRAVKLLEGAQYSKARAEITAMISQLTGPERETALVKIGVVHYLQRQTAQAERYLSTLTVESPEADGERLYYLVLNARRANNRDAMKEALSGLEQRYPTSKWRLQAIVALADTYLVENDVESYEPLYRACYESFPKDPRADGCHWKFVAAHALRRSSDALDLLSEHLRNFPGCDETPAALYFLARLSEEAGSIEAARTYDSEISSRFPNHFHAVLAREKLAGREGVPPAPASSLLSGITLPSRVRTRDFEPNALAKARLERSRLLSTAGLDEWAETELRYAAQNEDQPHVMALELASAASRRGAPQVGIRYIKRYAPDYLYMPFESAPAEFWRLAYPLPYRAEIEKYAKQYGLDPYFLAALIRQESEFDPKAISSASARGLTQIMPGTGRELSKALKIQPYSTARLLRPDVNVRIGAYFLKSVLDRFDGREEAALAAYNAGPRRANSWLMWGDYRDPAEFVEAVPFSQTRGYIQIVLRNADMYRRIYGGDTKPTQVAASAGTGSARDNTRESAPRAANRPEPQDAGRQVSRGASAR
jgi:soluble lytic murein transglycosylase